MAAPVQKTYRVGKNARLRLGDSKAVLAVIAGEVEPIRQVIDTTDFEDGGYGNYTRGVLDANVNISAWYPVGANPWQFWQFDALDIDTVGPVFLYLHAPDPANLTGPFFQFNGLAIERVPINVRVREVIPFNLFGKSAGTFVLPTT